MAFEKAQRKRVFVKLAITGPSGSGKTYGALQIAFGLARGGKVAVIDTENHSAELYSDLGDFDVCPIEPPFHSKKYLDAINEAVSSGYSVLVIDSMTHEWAGEGGILFRKEQQDNRGGNSFTNWAMFTPEHEAFKAAINKAPIHIIATMRSKQDFVLDQKGTPKKVGLAPIQRDGAEYEFTTVFDVALNHDAAVSKDRTGLFDGIIGHIGKDTGAKIAAWLDSGVSTADTLKPVETPPKPVNAPNNTANGNGGNTGRDRTDLIKGLHGASASKGFKNHDDVSLIACLRWNVSHKDKEPVTSLTQIPDDGIASVIEWLERPSLSAAVIADALKRHKEASATA